MAIFRGAVEGAGATVVGTLAHEFAGGGMTCVLVLAESHAVLHTWPETGTVNIDIFACSTRLEGLVAIAALGREFAASTLHIQEIPRVDGHTPYSARRA